VSAKIFEEESNEQTIAWGVIVPCGSSRTAARHDKRYFVVGFLAGQGDHYRTGTRKAPYQILSYEESNNKGIISGKEFKADAVRSVLV
jgi:hypothetical protein